ncbi:MAG: hypothetical protein HFH09_03440 [Bacilli bacterium]|jgi:hypothetical protein|nr:hypothetical protein [Bacilli bacterium]
MKQSKVEVIITPIYEKLKSKYQMLYGVVIKKNSMEAFILGEIKELKNKLTVEDALLFASTFSYLNFDLASQEQKLKREFIYCHLVYLFPKRMVTYSFPLLCLVCDAITEKNVHHILFLKFLSDETWMLKVLEHTLIIDYHSSLVNQYRIDQERIRRVFHFLCRRIEDTVKEVDKKVEFAVLKKEVLKNIKSYQSAELYKRSVT